MQLNDKIKSIIASCQMTPSHFADEIGVQRSSISHILSGRNRPSLEIIQKIVNRFPDITYDWLLDNDEIEPATLPSLSQQTVAPGTPVSKNGKHNVYPPLQAGLLQTALTNETHFKGERTIEKILIFYSDHTFTEYNPSSKSAI